MTNQYTKKTIGWHDTLSDVLILNTFQFVERTNDASSFKHDDVTMNDETAELFYL